MSVKQSSPASENPASKAINQVIVYVKHWRLTVLLFLFAITAGLTYYVYCKPVYRAKSMVKFNFLNLPIHSESGGEDTPYFRLRRSLIMDFNSRHLIERTAMRLGLVESAGSYETIREQFISAVGIEIIDDFKFLIEVQPYSPEIAEVWGEAMVEEYLEYQSDLRMEYNEEAIESYTRELAQIKERMLESLDDRIDFETESDFARQSLKAAEYNRLLTDLFMIRQQIRSAERTEAAIAAQDLDPLEVISRLAIFTAEIASQIEPVVASTERPSGPIQVRPAKTEQIRIESGAATSTQWERLRAKQDELLAAREEASKKYLPGHQRMVELAEQLSLLEKQIEFEARTAIESFRAQLAQMRETEASLESQLPEGREAAAELSKKELEFNLMKAQLPWEKAYADVQQKLEAIDFGAGKERIVLHHEKLDDVSTTPISPNKMKLVYASSALGLALAFGLPFLLERFNHTASKIDELERELNMKGLGIVPVTPVGELENIVRAPEAEARIPNSLLENFRVIRAGIALNQDSGRPTQVIMLTSARPSEGKTVNSCNLGWAFASINEPTLVIDSDLRRGRVHKVLELPNNKGLSNVLAGELDLDEAIQPTKVPNLWAITRGPVIPGMTERLFIQEHDQRMQELRNRFSRIIMDTPPVLGLSETATLMRLVDGVVMVIRAERTSRRDVRDAATVLAKSGAHLFGFVLNRLDLSRLSNYYNYYYYSSYYYDQMIDDDDDEPVRHRQSKR